MLKALFVIPVAAIAIVAFATPKFVNSNKNTTEVADTCDAEIRMIFLKPEEILSMNETAEDAFILDGQNISLEQFKKIDMNSVAQIGILSKEATQKLIGEDFKGRAFYIISQKLAHEQELMKNIEIRVNRQDRIMFDTDYVNLSDLSDSIKKQVNSPDYTIVSLEVSEKASQSTVSAIKDILRENGILKVVYSVHKETEENSWDALPIGRIRRHIRYTCK